MSEAIATVDTQARDNRWVDLVGSRLPVVAPAALLSVVLAGIAAHLVLTDFWVGLVSGREVWQHGIPSSEHLTSLAAGHHWVDQQWLAQLAMYASERIGGVGLTVAVCSAAVVACFVLCAAVAHRRGASPTVLLLFFCLAFLAGPWGVQARTQALALPLFGLVVWLLCRDTEGERKVTLAVLPALCLWANLHGSVLLGVAIVAAYGVALIWHRRPVGLIYALAAPLCVFVSPYGFSLFGYYETMTVHSPFGQQIVEWQRTTPSRGTAVFFLLGVVAVVLLFARRNSVRLFDALLLVVTFAFGLFAIRLTPWFGLAALAVLPPLATRHNVRFHGIAAAVAAVTTAAVVLASFALIPGRAVPLNSWRPDRLAAVRELPARERVFANLELADWLLWEVPSLRGRVAYDGRPELLTRREFDEVVMRATTFAPGWQRVLARYQLVVLDPSRAARLVRLGGWRKLATAPRFVLMVRSPRRSDR
jgi:hypothetical protein